MFHVEPGRVVEVDDTRGPSDWKEHAAGGRLDEGRVPGGIASLDIAAAAWHLPGMSLDVKICGLRTPEAVDAALAGGSTHIGFIFFPKSPRHVTPDEAARLRERAQGKALAVAVTVDASDAQLDEIVATMRPDMLQLHGKETPDRVLAVKARYGLPVIKALSIGEAADLGRLEPYKGVADRFLLDAKPPAGSELPGGNGVAFDWSILQGLEKGTGYLLSGGLTPDNVGEALRQASPPGLDVSSGVESAPGVKDLGRIEAFFRAIELSRR